MCVCVCVCVCLCVCVCVHVSVCVEGTPRTTKKGLTNTSATQSGLHYIINAELRGHMDWHVLVSPFLQNMKGLKSLIHGKRKMVIREFRPSQGQHTHTERHVSYTHSCCRCGV